MLEKATNFKRHLQQAKGNLFVASLVLVLQAVSVSLLPLLGMVLVDRVLVPNSTGTAPSVYRIIENWLLQGQFLAETSLPSSTQLLMVLAIALLVLTGLSVFLEFAERVSISRAAYRIVEGLREELISQLMTRRQSYLDRKRKSDLVARLSSDAASLEYLISSGLTMAARALPTLVFLFTVLFALKTTLALLTAAALPLSYFLSLYFSRGARLQMAKLRSETNHFESESAHLFAAAPAVKSLRLENFALRALHERLESIGQHIINLRRADGALHISLSGTRHFLRVMLILLGGLGVLSQQMTLGSLLVFFLAVAPLSRAVNAIAQFVSDYGRAAVSLERIEALFRELQGEEETQGPQALISLPFPDATTLHFEDVSFAFPNMPPLLSGFNARFQAGELIALMGPSGSGRTTFGHLINRLVDPSTGKISLGRTDLRRFRLEVLRTYVTVLDSDPFFVPGTVRENLLLGAETSEVREQQISEALHAANATSIVQALPEELETVIGEGGFELSASQKRILSFARALLRDQSQIFVLDEPTLGLDPDNAQAVVEAIHRLAERGAMVFWITNKLAEIPMADQVIFFSRNSNPMVGTHKELLLLNPTYRSYFVSMESARPPRERERTPQPELEV